MSLPGLRPVSRGSPATADPVRPAWSVGWRSSPRHGHRCARPAPRLHHEDPGAEGPHRHDQPASQGFDRGPIFGRPPRSARPRDIARLRAGLRRSRRVSRNTSGNQRSRRRGAQGECQAGVLVHAGARRADHQHGTFVQDTWMSNRRRWQSCLLGWQETGRSQSRPLAMRMPVTSWLGLTMVTCRSWRTACRARLPCC
jgi:hypothetical protein